MLLSAGLFSLALSRKTLIPILRRTPSLPSDVRLAQIDCNPFNMCVLVVNFRNGCFSVLRQQWYRSMIPSLYIETTRPGSPPLTSECIWHPNVYIGADTSAIYYFFFFFLWPFLFWVLGFGITALLYPLPHHFYFS